MSARARRPVERVDAVAGGYLRPAGDRRGRCAGRERCSRRPSRRSSTCCAIATSTRRSRSTMRSSQGLSLVDLHQRSERGRALPVGRGIGLRHRQRQHRAVGRRDRRRVRRREGNRRRARERLGQLARLHAARRPTPSITGPTCRWPRASASTSLHELERARRSTAGPASARSNSSFQAMSSSGSSGRRDRDSPGRRRSRARAAAAAARRSRRLPR